MKAKLFHYNQLLLCSLVVAFMFVSKPIAYSQDVWLQNHLSPNSGCGLSAIENVTVLIYNNSSNVPAWHYRHS